MPIKARGKGARVGELGLRAICADLPNYAGFYLRDLGNNTSLSQTLKQCGNSCHNFIKIGS